jgi:hypothetical protein
MGIDFAFGLVGFVVVIWLGFRLFLDLKRDIERD